MNLLMIAVSVSRFVNNRSQLYQNQSKGHHLFEYQ